MGVASWSPLLCYQFSAKLIKNGKLHSFDNSLSFFDLCNPTCARLSNQSQRYPVPKMHMLQMTIWFTITLVCDVDSTSILESFCFSFFFASLLPDEKATFDGNFSAQPFWHLHYFWLIFSLDPSLDIYITFPEDENKNTSVLAQLCFIKQQFLQIFRVVANIKEIIK